MRECGDLPYWTYQTCMSTHWPLFQPCSPFMQHLPLLDVFCVSNTLRNILEYQIPCSAKNPVHCSADGIMAACMLSQHAQPNYFAFRHFFNTQVSGFSIVADPL